MKTRFIHAGLLALSFAAATNEVRASDYSFGGSSYSSPYSFGGAGSASTGTNYGFGGTYTPLPSSPYSGRPTGVYDRSGRRVGTVETRPQGGAVLYDNRGRRVGSSTGP